MGQIVVNVGSFDLTSHNGNTAYSSVRYFDIPANAGITSCVATFAQHVNTGSFQGKSFSLNGAQAHPNTPWPTSGIALNVALLSAGQNTFRAAVKSQAGLSARWSIGDIYLTINYNDVSGGGGGYDPGVISLNKSRLTAGGSLTVSVTGASSGVYRDVYIQKMPSIANIKSVVQGHGSGAGSWTITIPESWCETLSPNDPSFEVRIYMVAYVAGGTVVGDGAKMLTVNVPASAVPTIGTFTATLNKNGVDASITGYVQNYSKVGLAIGGEAGALGSGISSYEITGGGKSAATKTTTFGPFSQTGNITFTAKVTDSRGRTGTKTVTINMLAYARVSGKSISAYRSNGSSVADDEGAYVSAKGTPVISSLGGQNEAIIKGRVYEKGTTPGSWVTMTSGTIKLFGGSYSVEKGYTAEISINDKITSTVYIIHIPTATVGIHIMPGATGGGFGMYGQEDGWYFSKKLVAPGLAPNPNLLHNWDFRNPINQRGVSGTVSASGYFIDRWLKYAAGDIVITSSGITCSSSMEQRIEGTGLAGKTATFSIMIGGVIHAKTLTFPASTGAISSGTDMPMDIVFAHDTTAMRVRISAPPGALTYQAVKLELGTVSTLHLDPPMDHTVELPKCQRFFQVIDNQTSLYGFAVSTTSIYATIPLTTTMRALPTLSHTDATMRGNGAVHTGTASPTAITASGLRITVAGTGFPNAHVITGRIGPSSGFISLSADL